MSVFKCKMCGGELEISADQRVATCEYCGTVQTLPKLDNDRRTNLYDRANHFRRNNDFDKAMGIYEQILGEDRTDAEAYWSLVLCRYGIEYVEDPATHKRVPTVNRAQFTAVFDDENYKSALQYADSAQRTVYESEAKAINEIQKGILAISQKEEPFDVFICYKETDANGRRTPDSVLANDIYHQLTQEGFKVFFSRITLEDKLGADYEPYIFAALNSARVMVVLGTKPEYFTAVWVKNEWSRYLSLIRQGQKKILIPAFKDMDPYDLPEEFSHLQAQDMGKLGFMQDLIRGIKKLTQTDKPTPTVVKETVISGGGTNTAPLLRRAFLFLEDGEWDSADEYCEKVLDIEPENARAYLGKLMADLHVSSQADLKDEKEPFDDNGNYQKVLRFGDEDLKATLEGYIDFILARNENARLADSYSRACSAMRSANTELEFQEAARLFESISEYEDSALRAKRCRENAEEARKDAIYSNAEGKMKLGSIESYERAINLFAAISGWRDADEQTRTCEQQIKRLTAKAEAARMEAERREAEERIEAERREAEERIEAERREAEERIEAERQRKIREREAARIARRNKKIAIITASIVCTAIAFVIVLNEVIIPNGKYNDAVALMDAGQYEEAIAAFEAMDGYKESVEQITECKYLSAVALMDVGQYHEAIAVFEMLVGYKDSTAQIVECKRLILKNPQVSDYVFFGTYEQDNDMANGKENIEWLVLDRQGDQLLVISKYALDCKQYNTKRTDVTWETCSLHRWLNSDFVNVAFSADEKAMLTTVTVSADKNPDYSTDPGNATQDQVFLLSIDEAENYFSSDKVRECAPTDYAVSNGAFKSSSGNCCWWLRSPGHLQYYAAYVDYFGGVHEYGNCVDIINGAVRPALWIDLES